MPVMELLSMLGGSAVGFLFRFIAQKSQDQKEMFQQMMAANKQTTDNQNRAVERVGIDVGRSVRQLIVLSVLFSTLLAPFVLPFFGVPTFVEVDATQTNLFGMDNVKKYFVEINGFLFTSENRQILLSIVGFYFGSTAAANKS
jgi:hypothetical protein